MECPECTHLRNDIVKATCAAKKTVGKTATELDQLQQIQRNAEEKLEQHHSVVGGNHVSYTPVISIYILIIFFFRNIMHGQFIKP